MNLLPLVFFLLISFNCNSQELEFYVGEKKVSTLTLAQMIKIGKVEEIKLDYHFSKSKVKNYKSVSFNEIIKSAFKKELDNDKYSEVIFEATDGYQAFSEKEKLLESGSYLAFKDLDVKNGWEGVGRSMKSPAPFILIWKGDDKTSKQGYPWPWGLKKIKLVQFEKRYKSLVPKVKKDNQVYKGFLTYKKFCFRCHAINKVGGKIGPDLGAPKNITSYRDDQFLVNYIKNPENYRYSKMPAHEFLGDSSINQIISYLKSFK